MKVENFVREGHNLKIDIFGSLNDFEKFSPAAPIQHNMIINGSFLFHGTLKIYDLKNFRLRRAIGIRFHAIHCNIVIICVLKS